MERNPIVLDCRQRLRLERRARRTPDAAERVRYLIVLRSAEGWSRRAIAFGLGSCEAHVVRVRRRWRESGESGLIDRREDNGVLKADAFFHETVRQLLRDTPPHYGHRRPSWTMRLLIAEAAKWTGVTVSARTMGRVLRSIGARRGRPKPSVAHLGWSKQDKNKRLSMIHRLVETLPNDEAAVWEDEVDIDLNPRIGFDWMLRGSQRIVSAPGKNIKRYLAGAMDARTDRLVWVRGDRKRSVLFIALLRKLLRVYADRKVVHVILDNYSIHSSGQTRAFIAEHGEKLRLHFLPPYCPDDNRIERCVWRELHQNVTYNHRHNRIEALMADVVHFLVQRNRRKHQKPDAELRRAI